MQTQNEFKAWARGKITNNTSVSDENKAAALRGLDLFMLSAKRNNHSGNAMSVGTPLIDGITDLMHLARMSGLCGPKSALARAENDYNLETQGFEARGGARA